MSAATRRLRLKLSRLTGRPIVFGRADHQRVRRIVKLSDSLMTLGDNQLRARFLDLGENFNDSGNDAQIEQIIEPAFACIREAGRRALGMAHYDVQLAAGMVLARGGVAEMATGEGKTLVATLPGALHGLTGNGSHVMTVNDYLAERDFKLMRPVFELLGLTCGLLVSGASNDEKRLAYAADVTYGTGPEFGFDYLRDQLDQARRPKLRLGQSFTAGLRGFELNSDRRVQREFGYALVDEADSVMIDEANSALILSGSSGNPNPWPQVYQQAHGAAQMLVLDEDFYVDVKTSTIGLSESGVAKIFRAHDVLAQLKLDRPWRRYVEQALRAQHLIERDVDYVVVDGKVQIVDEYTGRRFEDRSWSEGLHQAVEANEDVSITEESDAMMRVSRQRYLGLYASLSGMTGTAVGCEQEFVEMFNLPVTRIARRVPSQRVDEPIVFFANHDSKMRATVNAVVSIHETGQPVLVGTRSVKSSEEVANALGQRGITARVLNARHDSDEAELIAGAGHLRAVTIATNMAGRGSDIPLGPGVDALGGLAVIVVEANESSRIDRQLVGRAGRQGDPGVSHTFACPEDALITQHAPALLQRLLATRADVDGRLAGDFAGDVAQLQRHLEEQGFQARRALVRRDEWLHEILEKAV